MATICSVFTNLTRILFSLSAMPIKTLQGTTTDDILIQATEWQSIKERI